MDLQNQEQVLEKLRKQLGVAVRSIQWSYAIYWSLSTTQQRVLEWGEGYYNGDIMTRTGPVSEVYADKLGLQRSQQLRELYESLLDGESDGETKRPPPALSPEDLTDLEWYYLVCMSFVFESGQSLPGRALASGQSIWLCNAQDADSKVFSRSLLAKSASVKTVICFPHSGGVIELGVTDLVSEDPKLIHRVKTTLLEFAKPICIGSSTDQHNADYDKDSIGTKINVMNQELRRSMSLSEEFNDCSGNCCDNSQQEDSCVFSDNQLDLKEVQECNSTNFCSLEIKSNDDDEDDLHYKRALSVVLERSNHFVENQSLYSSHNSSSFSPWKKELAVGHFPLQSPQRALKTMLFKVPFMITQNPLNKEREDENYRVLRSMIPSTNKIGKTSILKDTIEHLHELEARVEELESCVNESDSEVNLACPGIYKMWLNKRKACDIIGENEAPVDANNNNAALDVNVSMNGHEVLVEIQSPWRDYLLLDIIDAMNNLRLDAHTVQSSTTDGILSVTLKSKFRGAAFAPAGMIKHALRGVVGLC